MGNPQEQEVTPDNLERTADGWKFVATEHAFITASLYKEASGGELLRIQHNGSSFVMLSANNLGFNNGAIIVKPGDVFNCTGWTSKTSAVIRSAKFETIL